MTTFPKIRIDFRIGAEKWARRSWWAVPRVGDYVLLGAGKDRFPPDHNGDAMFKVKQIVWGAESQDDHDAGYQTVIAIVEHHPTKVKEPV